MKMKSIFLGYTCFICGSLLHAQVGTYGNMPNPTVAIVFSYDDAGNQVYRGPIISGKQSTDEPKEEPSETKTAVSAVNEEAFWRQLSIYPVPVKDVLTIAWTDEVNDLISSVSLYEQNTVHWKFQQQNIPNLNKQIRIDMTNYYMGVYVLTFNLKDGRILSRNILKF